MPLYDELVFTYMEGRFAARESVSHGWWVSYNPVEDDLTPETTFTDHILTYKLPPREEDNVEEANNVQVDQE